MILSVLLSAALTFTATATGVEKGTAVEFFLVGANSDRDYEAMFLLDEPIDAFCARIEKLVTRGTPVDAKACRLWPTGCRLRFEPSFDAFVTMEGPEGGKLSEPVYTGGSRRPDGSPDATAVMPAAVFATYSLPQAPIVYNIPVDQGSAYGWFKAARTLKKGEKITFTLTVDEKSAPRKIAITAEKGNLSNLLNDLRSASANGDVEACVAFSDDLTVSEAVAISQALAVIDSCKVKINGSNGLFYRAFLPLEKWRDRQERIHQPFELSIRDDGTEELLFIEEDWSVEGDDPKLTPRPIPLKNAASYPQTDTCFVYCSKTQTVGRLTCSMKKLKDEHIVNWYVFPTE